MGWNEKTGETTWDPPEEVMDPAPMALTNGRPPSPLPPWKLAEHPDAPGEWYFLNEETGVTTWDEPEGAYSRTRKNKKNIRPSDCQLKTFACVLACLFCW